MMRQIKASWVAPPPAPIVLENKFLKVYVDPTRGLQAVLDKETDMNFTITHELYHYTASKESIAAGPAYVFSPIAPAVAVLGPNDTTTAATVALGPVMHEVRLSITDQHKTRIRLLQTDDPITGRRLEIGHRIGVLEPWTEIASRFTAPELSNGQLHSEDNAYEVIAHPPADNRGGNITYSYYPSQASVFLRDGPLQLSVALDRSHGVASPEPGTLEVMQHRRGGAYTGTGGTVVLDDADRIFTQTWISLGSASQSNALRTPMKLRLNHPPVLAFTRGGHLLTTPKPLMSASFPEALHLQSVRATMPDAASVLVRMQHMFSKGEDSRHSRPVEVSLEGLFPGLRGLKDVQETALNGLVPRQQRDAERTHFPVMAPHKQAYSGGVTPTVAQNATHGGVAVGPFEFRTFVFS